MGRKKIKIARITDDRNRSVTYLKRKAGLMKKAHELAVLTGSEVAVIVFGQNGKLTEFCSGDMDRVLLRYTEHSGPVERKGPENYSNEDDEGSDEDGEGGDGEDGENDADDAEGGAGSGSAGMGGSSGRQNTPPDRGRNGVEKQEQGTDSAKSNKRKAPSGHKRKDGNGNSISSEMSSKQGSPPYSMAPIIKVEGNDEDSTSTKANNSVDKGTLKAAIISRSSSKMNSGKSHHHSYSTGSEIRSGKLSPSSPSKGGNVSMPSLHRPRTADASVHAQASNQAMLSPQFNVQTNAGSASRFAYSLDTSRLQPQHIDSSGNYLQAQQWNDDLNPPQLNRASSASALGQDGMSYGDLARGGINWPMGTSYNAVHAGHSPMSPMQPQRSPHSLLQLPMQMQGAQPQMIPLAHPILRQHPQYEQYANQLRIQQQQQTLGRNSMSMVGSGVHTAPSSPNHLAMAEPQFVNQNSYTSGANLGIDASTVRRSASFGYINQQNNRRDFQQSLNNEFSFASNPFNLAQHDSGVSFAPSSTRLYPVQSSTFGQSSTLNSGDQEQINDASLSNADFNDLMGSIFSDMGSSNHSTLSEPVSNRNLQMSDEKLQESFQEQEEAIRSMESNGSLSTLVNSESFDALMADGNRKDMVMTSLDSPLVQQQKRSRNASNSSQDQSSLVH